MLTYALIALVGTRFVHAASGEQTERPGPVHYGAVKEGATLFPPVSRTSRRPLRLPALFRYRFAGCQSFWYNWMEACSFGHAMAYAPIVLSRGTNPCHSCAFGRRACTATRGSEPWESLDLL